MAYSNKNKKKGYKGKGRPKFSSKDRDMAVNVLDESSAVLKRPNKGGHLNGRNDISWYVHDSRQLKNAASIPYGYPLGTYLDLATDVTGETTQGLSHSKLSVSGIMTLGYVPTIGYSKDNNSPVNVAARKLYAYIRKANSGATNYDAPDLMMYIIAMDSLYTMYHMAKRAYGLINLYNPYNRYAPDMLVRAAGFDPIDLRSNLAQFRYLMNNYAARINNLVVPDTMPIFKRHRWMVSGCYTDSNDAKAQTYMYVPTGYYQLKYHGAGTETPGAAYLNWIPFNTVTTPLTLEEWSIIMEKLMAPLLNNNHDIGVMSGDILKAYDSSMLYQLDGVDEAYSVMPEYNLEVLMQLENATVLGNQLMDCDIEINNDVEPTDPNNGAIIFKPRTGALYYSYDPIHLKRIINMHHDNVSEADTMIATRLMMMGDISHEQGHNNQFYPTVFGSEIIERGYLWRYDFEGEMTYRTFGISDNILTSSTSTAAGQRYFDWDQIVNSYSLSVRLSHFEYHPMVVHTIVEGSSLAGPTRLTHYYDVEIDNYSVIDKSTLKQMHDLAMLSEFDI